MAKSKKHKKMKMKKNFKRFIILFIFVVLSFILITKFNINSFNDAKKQLKNIYNKMTNIINKGESEKKYNECMANPLSEENFSEATINKKNEILSYAQSNNLKYTYEDLVYGYQINYAENEPLYGASLIKLVAALYLIDNDVDLNQTIKYESKYKEAYSEGMEKHKYGEEIPISTLIKYAITYSDNTAYLMLYTYIGRSKMSDYAHSLGAKSIFTGYSDNFANQTTYDTNIYLKRAYQLFSEKESASILKEAMLNERKNRLNIPDKVTIAHKYGSYNEYFHNIGINLNDKYTISILTTKGENGSVKHINNLSLLTYEFNTMYKSDLDTYCKNYSTQKD